MQLPADYHMHTPLGRHAAGEPTEYAAPPFPVANAGGECSNPPVNTAQKSSTPGARPKPDRLHSVPSTSG